MHICYYWSKYIIDAFCGNVTLHHVILHVTDHPVLLHYCILHSIHDIQDLATFLRTYCCLMYNMYILRVYTHIKVPHAVYT